MSLTSGAIIGLTLSASALTGSAIGTISAIHNAKSRSERRYVILGYTTIWVICIGLILLGFSMDSPWSMVLPILLMILIPALVYRITLRAQLIRILERNHETPP